VITDNYRKDPSVGNKVWRVYVIVRKNKRKKGNAEVASGKTELPNLPG